MRLLILVFLTFFLSFRVNAQEIDDLKVRATLFAIADFTQFSFVVNNQSQSIDLTDLKDTYEVAILESDGLEGFEFFRITLSCYNCSGIDTCNYYLAYCYDFKRFYTLSGFKKNEFDRFIDFLVYEGLIGLEKRTSRKKKLLKYVFQNVVIEDLDLEGTYKEFKNNQLAEKSCYRKSIIRAY